MDNSNVSSLGAVGMWTMALDFQPAERVRELAAELEELGFGALWHGEAFGRDTVSQSWLLLSSPGHRLLAALGPMMTELATVRASGVHTYLVPVEHTRRARSALGSDALIAVEPAVALSTDPTTSWSLARDHVAYYVGTAPYHRRNLARLGYQDADLDGPSDRLVHDLVATGDLDAVASRVREQLAAGANHVCLQVLTGDPAAVPLEQWRELADLNVAIISPNLDAHLSNPDKHQHQIDTTQGGDHR